jgi:sulfide:quinone oxidoreductase
MEKTHRPIVIVGGGTAGIVCAAILARAGVRDVCIIEPSERHFYQPLWTLVGAGVVPKEITVRSEARFVPAGTEWLKDSVCEIAAEKSYLTTRSGVQVGYDFLILAPGVKLDWDAIPGLREAVGTKGVSTNYDYDLAPKTWQSISEFRGGTALFHMPGTPIKCPGAPQKIAYLAADHFRRSDVARDANVIYASALGGIYGIKEYATILNRVVERYGIDARYNHELVEIRPAKREAVFRLKADPAGAHAVIPYDILHVAPPQTPPDFVRQSPLVDAQGWVKVDQHTMRNPDFPNVFALGDVAGTPNAKTGASACKQAPVVVSNLLSAMRGDAAAARYEGYVACPIVTGYGRMLLCEFDYSGKPTPTLPLIDTFRERYDMWLLKRYGLPWLYWHLMLRGRSVPFLHRGEVSASRHPRLAQGYNA